VLNDVMSIVNMSVATLIEAVAILIRLEIFASQFLLDYS